HRRHPGRLGRPGRDHLAGVRRRLRPPDPQLPGGDAGRRRPRPPAGALRRRPRHGEGLPRRLSRPPPGRCVATSTQRPSPARQNGPTAGHSVSGMSTETPRLVPEAFGPLEGVRILSTGTLIAQPFAAHLAGAFGAEVIQVEHPSGTCDPWRRLDFPVGHDASGAPVASSFVQERRNAFYITLDLGTPDGRDLFLRLVATRDIWMESSKPGTWSRWGLPDDVVLAANPALVITHVSGYGQTGDPGYLGRASYDMVGQAFGGLMFQTGFADPDPPVRAAPYTGDYITALFALWSSLAAYIHAGRTGQSQVVDLAQFEAVHSILAGTMVQYFESGTVRTRSGNKAPH